MISRRSIGVGLLAAIALLVLVGYWQLPAAGDGQWIMLTRRPPGVMGTECLLAVVMPRSDVHRATHALRDAEQILRDVEARMSNYLADSEVSLLCRADAGTSAEVSPSTMEVLVAARQAFQTTEGTFDVTCRPQLELWQRAAQAGELPGADARDEARAASRWDLLQLRDNQVIKRAATAGVDLGGIAKGYAIDRALQVLRQTGAKGAMVDVGGDLACFGHQANGKPWHVDIQDPAASEAVARLCGSDLAVATSGDYARYFEVNGARYSHILDPRICWPAEAARAATVIAPTTMAADSWATALSVLGTQGFTLLPEGTEALLIVAGEQQSRCVCTAGFAALLDRPLPAHWQRWQRPSQPKIPSQVSP